MKTRLKSLDRYGVHYKALMFVCPGCAEGRRSGVHMLPVNFGGLANPVSPAWDWDGKFGTPTLGPSILSHIEPYEEGTGKPLGVCHSFLREGIFEFLSDCTHSLAGQHVPIPDLPTWAEEMT